MLLCCFKEPKKRPQSPTSEDEDAPYAKGSASTSTAAQQQKRQSLISVSSAGSTGFNSGLRPPPLRDRRNERAPLQREEKRLLKQRSVESFRLQESSNLPFIDQSPPVAAAESLECVGLVTSEEEGSSAETSPLRIQAYPYSAQYKSAAALSASSSQSSTPAHNGATAGAANVRRREKPTHSRGMTRSSASYGIQQLLQEQIIVEEEKAPKSSSSPLSSAVASPGGLSSGSSSEAEVVARKVTEKYDALVNDLKRKHAEKIQELKREYQTSLSNAKNNNESELKWRVSRHEAELTSLKKAHAAELEQLRKEYERNKRAKETEHTKVIEEFKLRDNEWKQEKQDVLAEIQRLKDEANRFIAILSAEDESDDNLSPARRQTLTREVESLQLVVEMRTQEIHRLREERSRHLQQLEELESTKGCLAKMQAKVEDLTVQLERKSQMERQLSLEKSNLETSYEEESRKKARMSMQVEELQYRIKNKMELPPTKVVFNGSVTSLGSNSGGSPGRPTSLPQTLIQTNGLLGMNKHAGHASNNNNNVIVNNNNNNVVNSNNNCQIRTSLVEVKRKVDADGEDCDVGDEVVEQEEVLEVTVVTQEAATLSGSKAEEKNKHDKAEEVVLRSSPSKKPLLPLLNNSSSFTPAMDNGNNGNNAATPNNNTDQVMHHHHPHHLHRWHTASPPSDDIPDIPPPPYEEASGSGATSSSDEDQHGRRLEDSLEKLVGGSQGDSDRESDEGLGDISSSEASSPHPVRGDGGTDHKPAPVTAKLAGNLNSVPEEESATAATGAVERRASVSSSLLASPSDERMPSRIPLSVQTAL